MTAMTTLALQTAPMRNEAMFTSVAGAAATYLFSGTPTVGLQSLVVIQNPALHRFLRWSLAIGTVATSVHFRIWLNLNPTGW